METTIAAISTAMSASGIWNHPYQRRECYGCDFPYLQIKRREVKK